MKVTNTNFRDNLKETLKGTSTRTKDKIISVFTGTVIVGKVCLAVTCGIPEILRECEEEKCIQKRAKIKEEKSLKS